MTKNERQKIGIQRFIDSKMKGALDYVMRFGKTLTAIKIIDYYTANNFGNVVVIVPSIAILEVWKQELDNYKSYYSYNNDFKSLVTLLTITNFINTYNTIDNIIGLLIVDEIHRFTSDIRLNIISGKFIKYNNILGLTGSYPYNNITINKYCPVIDKISETEAIRNNWISNFVEFNIKLDLTDEDKEKYIKHSNIMNEVFDIFKDSHKRLVYNDGRYIFNSDFEVIMACYSGKKIDNVYVKSHDVREALSQAMGYNTTLKLDTEYNKNIDKYWNPINIKNNVTKYYTAMQQRNVIHNYNEVKLKAVLELYLIYKDKNIITFNGSIDMADAITDSVNNTISKIKAVSYHSKIKSKYITDFITGKILTTKAGKPKKFSAIKQLDHIKQGFKYKFYNMLNTVNAVDEGFDLDILDMVITTSGSTNPVQYAQRTARGKTINYYNPNKITIIINLFFDDFIDEKGKFYKSRDKTKLKIRQQNKYIATFTMNEFKKYMKKSE